MYPASGACGPEPGLPPVHTGSLVGSTGGHSAEARATWSPACWMLACSGGGALPMRVSEAVTTAVASEGFDHLFAVMGDANQDLIVNLGEKLGVKFVHAHHEGSAVSMADGYARFSDDKMGLASVTQGPGYTNATTSLVAARLHRTPVLLLAGQCSLRDPYNPQGGIDQHALAKLTT